MSAQGRHVFPAVVAQSKHIVIVVELVHETDVTAGLRACVVAGTGLRTCQLLGSYLFISHWLHMNVIRNRVQRFTINGDTKKSKI